MATEVGIRAPGAGTLSHRLRERISVWRRLFFQNWNLFKASRIGVVGLAIMLAFVVLALAAPFMGLRDPIRWTAPDEDLIAVQPFWQKDSSVPGSEFVNAPPFSQPLAFRVIPESFEPPADRLYAAAGNRLYALSAGQGDNGKNAWGTPSYFNVTEGGPVYRNISVPPLAMNFGDYVQKVPDYELYLGTDDGTFFIIRDMRDTLPFGDSLVHRMGLDGKITGLAAYNGDMEASIKPGTSPARPAIQGAASYVYYDGTQWVTERLNSSGDDGEFTSLALDSSGTPHMAYYTVWSGQPKLFVRSGGNWRLFSTAALLEPSVPSINVGLYTSLAIGTDNRPQIAYFDETERDLKFARWNGSGWNVSYIEYTDDVGRFPSLALNSLDHARIAYYNDSARSLQFASFDGTSWTVEVVDPGADVGQYASLAIDAAGDPHIAYYNATARALMYVHKVGAFWSPPEIVDQGNDVGQYASIALDSTGQPHVAYYDATVGALKYATKVVTWSNVTVDNSADVGRYTSIAINATGPAIAYHDATDLDLKYAWWNGSTWLNETRQSQGHAGLYNSLRFDAQGRPRIAYYSFVTGRTTADLVLVGTATGKLYAIDVGIPGTLERIPLSLPREKVVQRWAYRIRWVADLGAEVHLATSPLNTRSSVPLYSPCFLEDGTVVFSGTSSGRMIANYTSNATAYWPRGSVYVGAPWSTAPIVEQASEGPMDGQWVAYAASNHVDVDGPIGPAPNATLLFARNATTGDPIREWGDRDDWVAFDWASPVEPGVIGVSDGGNLTQPTIGGNVIYVGSTSGWLYAIRRDAVGGLPPASIAWRFRDQALFNQDIHPELRNPPVIVSKKGVLVISANHDSGTPDPTDNRGVLYAIKLEGQMSWKKTFPAPLSGQPASWKPSGVLSLDENVWVAWGDSDITGVSALRTTGSFLAPSPPSWIKAYPSGNQYWLGLDSQGRDIFSQVIWGSRIALLVGFLSAFFTVVLGVVVGLIAGYVGGKVESVLMRFTDVILVLPGLPLIITLAAVLGASIWNIILVISLLGWPGIARIIRAEVLSLKERPFIDSARVTGASTTRIVFRHIAPNVMPLAFLYMTFAVSGAILTEAALSFIGLGDISTMSWGIMLQQVSQSRALTAWWWLLPPGLAITLISLAFFLVGRAFDEIVNPRLRKR